MSKVYVNIDRLKERYQAGQEIRSRIQEDLDRIDDDLKRLKESGSVSAEELGSLTEGIKMLRKVADNITAVCEYDRYAIERYAAAAEKVEDMTEGIRL